ncbi:hypothetical protein ACH5RR_008778 [Cinchona calisaya]|uniref:Uncharacterized protein n=1 Tax=Cinchona calisaya TaxID=153742 RepID=A0ABD3ACA5_9GENT
MQMKKQSMHEGITIKQGVGVMTAFLPSQLYHTALRDDHHVRFFTRKKKVINEGEVFNYLLNLDEVSCFPHSRERLTRILCRNQAKTAIEVSSSPRLSGIRHTQCKRKIYPVTRTILIRHATHAFKESFSALLND